MNPSTALLIIAITSFLSMVFVLNEANSTNKDILNGKVSVKGEVFLCRKENIK